MAVLSPNAICSVDHSGTEQQEDGTAVQRDVRNYFQVLGISHSRRRDNTMHTFDKADAPEHSLSIAIEVQLMERWNPEGQVDGDGEVRVYPEGDAEWMDPGRIAPYESMSKHLWRYEDWSHDPEQEAVLVWSGARRAKPDMSITDSRFPTACLMWLLSDRGWLPVDHGVTHTKVLPVTDKPEFDGREAAKHKFYLQTLLDLKRCLGLAGGALPSQQPLTFYRLLLRGEAVLPFLGNKHYVTLWNQGKGIKKRDLLPIEDGPAPVPLPGDDNIFSPCQMDQQRQNESRARLHRAGGPRPRPW